MALRGNLSASLLTTGQPHEVDAAVKHLVDQIWARGGKLILDGSFGIPDETPVANVRAMFDAARRYAGWTRTSVDPTQPGVAIGQPGCPVAG